MMMIYTNDLDLEMFTALHLPSNLKLFDILITVIIFIWLFLLL